MDSKGELQTQDDVSRAKTKLHPSSEKSKPTGFDKIPLPSTQKAKNAAKTRYIDLDQPEDIVLGGLKVVEKSLALGQTTMMPDG